MIVLGDFDKWVNYAGVARHFSDAYVIIANEAENVAILPTLAGINYYQGKSFSYFKLSQQLMTTRAHSNDDIVKVK